MKKYSFLLIFIIIVLSYLLSYLFHGHIYFVFAPIIAKNSPQYSKKNTLTLSSIDNNYISPNLLTLPLAQSLTSAEVNSQIETEFNLTSYILSMPANKSWFYSDEVSYQMNSCPTNGSRWTTLAINNWYSKLPLLIGCNFIPSSAINPIEMWAADTFDTRTIEKELRWASEIFSINSLRVYLHFAPFEENPSKFIENIQTFLHIADTFSMNVLFVLFDDCWRPVYSTGEQPKPKIGRHNHYWVQNPGRRERGDRTLWPRLQEYVTVVVSSFASDRRILGWDVWNEPGNFHHGLKTLPLMAAAVSWVRSCRPSQPVTIGVYAGYEMEMNRFQLCNSDFISFHYYGNVVDTRATLLAMRAVSGRRPLVCTEYLARTLDSTPAKILPLFNEFDAGSYGWGLVEGKTNTIWPWDYKPPRRQPPTWRSYLPDVLAASGEHERFQSYPAVWFHDLLYRNGSVYDTADVAAMRQAMQQAQKKRLRNVS